MYDYNYDYSSGYYASTTDLGGVGETLGAFAAISGVISIVSIALSVFLIISQWKLFTKAGKPGWASIIPIYNIIVLIEIAGLPTWNIVFFFIPFANIYIMFKIYIELAHKFGKSTGFGVLTVFFSFICIPILAFGKNNVYNGGIAQTQVNNMTTTGYNPQAVLQQEQNNMENNAPNSVMPPMFDQNINTQINPIPSVQETPVAPTPIINPQPEINATPIVEAQPVNNMVNEVNPIQQDNSFSYNPNMNQAVEQPIMQPVNSEPPIAPTVPTPVEPLQATNIISNPQPVVNPEPSLNVIPGMGSTLEPVIPAQNPGNNPNNTNM